MSSTKPGPPIHLYHMKLGQALDYSARIEESREDTSYISLLAFRSWNYFNFQKKNFAPSPIILWQASLQLNVAGHFQGQTVREVMCHITCWLRILRRLSQPNDDQNDGMSAQYGGLLATVR